MVDTNDDGGLDIKELYGLSKRRGQQARPMAPLRKPAAVRLTHDNTSRTPALAGVFREDPNKRRI